MTVNLNDYVLEGKKQFQKGPKFFKEFVDFIPQRIRIDFNFMLQNSDHHLRLKPENFCVKFSDYINELIHNESKTK